MTTFFVMTIHKQHISALKTKSEFRAQMFFILEVALAAESNSLMGYYSDGDDTYGHVEFRNCLQGDSSHVRFKKSAQKYSLVELDDGFAQNNSRQDDFAQDDSRQDNSRKCSAQSTQFTHDLIDLGDDTVETPKCDNNNDNSDCDSVYEEDVTIYSVHFADGIRYLTRKELRDEGERRLLEQYERDVRTDLTRIPHNKDDKDDESRPFLRTQSADGIRRVRRTTQ